MIHGERIRQIRKLRRLTQAQLAELVGIKQGAVSQIEVGLTQPSPEVLDAIVLLTGFPQSFFQRPAGPEFPLGSLLLH